MWGPAPNAASPQKKYWTSTPWTVRDIMIRLDALNSLIVVRDLSTKVSAARTLIQIIQQIYEGVFTSTSMLSIFNALDYYFQSDASSISFECWSISFERHNGNGNGLNCIINLKTEYMLCIIHLSIDTIHTKRQVNLFPYTNRWTDRTSRHVISAV